MKAAVLVKPRELRVETVTDPVPAPGEVRVRLRMTGICGSDIHFFKGDRLLGKPTIIGHEGLGRINMIGDPSSSRKIGERVVVEPNIPCMKCTLCLQGRGNICPNKRVIGVNEAGCFAEYICLPEEFCKAVPDSISDLDAVTIEPMAVAYHALFTANAKPGDAVVVVGLGAIGLLLTHLALAMGYRVFVMELVENKLELAVKWGAIAVPLFESDGELEDHLKKEQVRVIFECSGSARGASLAAASAPRGSQIVLVGLSENPATFQPLKLVREGIDIKGSIIYDHPLDFNRVIRLIEAGIIHPGQITSETFSIENIQEAITVAEQGNNPKIIISIP